MTMDWVLEGLMRRQMERDPEVSSEENLSQRYLRMMEYDWVPE